MTAINESFKMCSQKDSGLEMYSIKVNTVVEHSNQVKPWHQLKKTVLKGKINFYINFGILSRIRYLKLGALSCKNIQQLRQLRQVIYFRKDTAACTSHNATDFLFLYLQTYDLYKIKQCM